MIRRNAGVKKTIRIILCMLLVLSVCLSVPLPEAKALKDSGSTSYFTWTYDDGIMTITPKGSNLQLKGSMIPSDYRSIIYELRVNSGVTSIAEFRNLCPRLEKLVLPTTLTRILSHAFDGAESLEQVNVRGALSLLGSYAFANCPELVEVKIAEGLETISSYAFQNSGLQQITFPASLKLIEVAAFAACKNLNRITFKGPAPQIRRCFYGTSRIYAFTETEDGWNADNMVNYGGDIVWVSGPAPTITAEPQDLVLMKNEPAEFTVGAHGLNDCDTLSYQWYMSINSGQTWTKLVAGPNNSGEQTESLKIGAAYANYDGMTFRCLVSAKNGDGVYTRAASLYVVVTPSLARLDNRGTGKGVNVVFASNRLDVAVLERKAGSGEWLTMGSQYSSDDFIDKHAELMGETYAYRVYGTYKGKITDRSEEKSIIRNPFTDVSLSSSYFSKVAWAYNNKIVAGTTSTTFSPESSCTRANFTVMLWKYAGKPEPASTKNPFSDVKSGMGNQYKAILWAYHAGIIKGFGNGKFMPNESLTRKQIIIMLWKYAGKPDPGNVSNPFTDTKNLTANEKTAILWAVKNNITSGTTSTTFSPAGKCKRYQIVTFLYKYSQM